MSWHGSMEAVWVDFYTQTKINKYQVRCHEEKFAPQHHRFTVGRKLSVFICSNKHIKVQHGKTSRHTVIPVLFSGDLFGWKMGEKKKKPLWRWLLPTWEAVIPKAIHKDRFQYLSNALRDKDCRFWWQVLWSDKLTLKYVNNLTIVVCGSLQQRGHHASCEVQRWQDQAAWVFCCSVQISAPKRVWTGVCRQGGLLIWLSLKGNSTKC